MEAMLAYNTTCDARTLLEAAYEPASKVSRVELETTPNEIRGVKKKRKETKTIFSISAADGRVTIKAPGLDVDNMKKLLQKVLKAIDPYIDDQGFSDAIENYGRIAKSMIKRDQVLPYMKPEERILFVSQGVESGTLANIIVTKDVVRIGRTGGFGGTGSKDIRISDISTVDYQGGVKGEKLILSSPGGGIGIRGLTGESGKDIAEGIRELIEQGRSTPGEALNPAPTVGPAEQIEKLANLHASGVLTDDEFAAAKARILGL